MLSFHHRAARTVDEITEVLKEWGRLQEVCSNTDDLALLQERNKG